MTDPAPGPTSIDLRALIADVASLERALSRRAREQADQVGPEDGGWLSWMTMTEEVVIGLRQLGRKLEQAAAGGGSITVSASPETGDSSSPRTVLRGDLASIGVSDLMGFISGLGKSGMLTIRSTTETFHVQFERGAVVFAHGDAPARGQLLGEILVQQGALSAGVLEQLVQGFDRGREVFGAYLTRIGAIGGTQLTRALARQAQMIFQRMAAVRTGKFGFEEGAQSRTPEDIRLNVIQLLLESARMYDEDRAGLELRMGVPLARSGESGERSPVAA